MEPITCRMIDFDADPDYVPVPGDMWFHPVTRGSYHVELSDEYRRDHAGRRPPLWVCITPIVWFPIDGVATNGSGGWTVTGEPPLITVEPSINVIGIWHGWLRNGVLTGA